MENINETKMALEKEANALIETHLRLKKWAAVLATAGHAESNRQLGAVGDLVKSAEESVNTAATSMVRASTLLGKAPKA
jgi:hypothetical protein